MYKHAFLQSANKADLFALKCVFNLTVLVIKSLFFILASPNMLALVPFLKEVLRSLSKVFREGATHHTGKIGLKMAAAALHKTAEPPLFSWLFQNQ